MTLLAKFASKHVLFVCALVLFLLSFTAWLRPLAMPDEGRYVGVAWEMVRNGDWAVPMLNGLPFFHKPPLFYWITAVPLSVFGPIEFAGRIAPIFGGFIGCMSAYFFVRFWLNKDFAFTLLITLLAFPAWFLGAQYANLDMLVAGLISVTTLLLAHTCFLITQNKSYKTWLLGAYAFAALGLLAKGLIGVVLPGVIIVSWLLISAQWRVLWKLVSIPGVLLFLGIASPWFIAMQMRYDGFSQYFFIEQHFKRFTSSTFNNVRPVYFYFLVLMLVTLPWWPWLLASLRSRSRSGQIESILTNLGDPIEVKIRLLMWVWLLSILLFFSIPSSKLIGYVLPAMVPLVYLISMRIQATKNGLKKLAFSAILGLLISWSVVAWFSLHTEKSSKEMASVLLKRLQRDEPVFLINNYTYDLPFYAGLQAPMIVVDSWAQFGKAMKDDWRKELFDARRFGQMTGAKTLLDIGDLGNRLCDSPRSWIVASSAIVRLEKNLATAELIGTFDDKKLWLINRELPETAAILKCERKPIADLRSR